MVKNPVQHRQKRSFAALCMRVVVAVFVLPFFSVCVCAQGMEDVHKVGECTNLTPVTLQLSWTHQFQFAGYYAAIKKGFYEDVGLQLELIEGQPDRMPIEEVLQGRAQFAVGNSEILCAFMQGKPLVALAPIFQTSPSILLARKDSGITVPQDLPGRRVMLIDRGVNDADLIAMLLNEGVDLDQVDIVPSSFNVEDLIDGNTDVFNAYLTSEPFYLRKKGIPCSVISPGEYGLHFYSDILFTSRSEVMLHPDMVASFLQASLRGWQYALEHPDEIIDIILSEYESNQTRDALIYEADMIKELMRFGKVGVGHSNIGRWEHMMETFVQLDMAPQVENLDAFLYNANAVAVPFTDEELQWIRQAPPIRIRVADWPPFEIPSDPPKGIAVELFEKAIAQTGLRYTYVTNDVCWCDALNSFKHNLGMYDVILTIKDNPERCSYLAFTDPYLIMQSVIFMRDREDGISRLDDLAGKTVVVEEGFYTQDELQTRYPGIELLLASNSLSALQALSAGKADVYVGNLLVASYLIRKYGLSNVKVVGDTVFRDAALCMGVRKDWPELVGILNKSLQCVPMEERAAIDEKWVNIKYDYGWVSKSVIYWVARIILIALAIIFGILLWNWRLRREIIKRELVEDAYKESEERYQILLDGGFDGIFIHDDQFTILDINMQMMIMIGGQQDDLLGANAARLFTPDSYDALQSGQTKTNNTSMRLLVCHKDGSVIPVEAFSEECRFHGKRASIVAMRDIRQQEKAEQILRANFDEMETRVHERTSELNVRMAESEELNRAMINILEDLQASNRNLNHMTAQLELANHELEAFAYSVSHDLRAPLRAIDGFSQAIEEDYGHLLDKAGKNYLARVREASQKMGRLIDDMLDLSRLTRSHMNLEMVNLSEIVEGISRNLRDTQPDRDVQFIIQPDVYVSADKRLITIAITNLLTNAWKFTAHHPYACIEFGVEKEGEDRAYFIKDDGAGFDMSYAGKLFGAFQRLHSQDEFPGTGIGLATVQRIIRRHEGKVWAMGKVEKGATFFFSLQ